MCQPLCFWTHQLSWSGGLMFAANSFTYFFIFILWVHWYALCSSLFLYSLFYDWCARLLNLCWNWNISYLFSAAYYSIYSRKSNMIKIFPSQLFRSLELQSYKLLFVGIWWVCFRWESLLIDPLVQLVEWVLEAHCINQCPTSKFSIFDCVICCFSWIYTTSKLQCPYSL